MLLKLKTQNSKLKTTAKILKVLSFTFLLYALTFTLLASPVFAQAPSTFEVSQTPVQSTVYSLPSTVNPTSPVYTDLLVHNMFHSFSCLAVGQSMIGQPCLTYQMTKNAEGMIQGIPVLSSVDTSGGVLGTTTSLIGALYTNRPIRTTDYLASVGQDLGVVKTANAQVVGSGAAVLNPVLTLWQVSRNISYVLMIIIFLIIGLMVMFRNKINPQTVITAQAALPGLVIGLIMITFSYFFAALLVDMAFVGTNVVGAYFSAAQSGDSSNLTEDLKNQNVLSIMSTFIGSAGIPDINLAIDNVIPQLGPGPGLIITTFASFLAYHYTYQFAEVPSNAASGLGCAVAAGVGVLNPVSAVTGATATTLAAIPPCIVNASIILRQVLGAAAAVAAAASPASVISIALYVILIAILIYTMFRLLLRLVTCFLTIILYTITAPFQFLIASLPGRQGIATGWILDMLANVLAFPAVIAVFYFVNYLLGSQAQGFLTNKPPFPVTGGPLDLNSKDALPLFGNLNIGFIRLLMAFGALMATPSIPDIISKAIGRVSQAGQLIGQEFGAGSRGGQQYLGQYGQSTQEVGSAVAGQRQWTYVPGKGYEYMQSQQGMISQIRDRFGRLRGSRKVGRNTNPLEDET